MKFFSRLPGTSLGMLLVAYLVFGYELPKSDLAIFVASTCIRDHQTDVYEISNWFCSLRIWLSAGVFAILVSTLLTAPLRRTKRFLRQWIKTDLGLFISSTLVVCGVVLFLWKLHIFATGMVLLAAGALARLNLQTAEFNEWEAFGLLVTFSLGGLILGWIFRYPEFIVKLAA